MDGWDGRGQMKITEITPVLLSRQLDRPLGTSRGDMHARTACLIRVGTDEGIWGLGEGVGDPQAIAAVVRERLGPALIGEDPFDTERLWAKLYQGAVYWERMGVTLCALSGIDLALWDIKGKALNVPVFQLLGGRYRGEIAAYASDLFWDEPETMAQRAAGYVSEGFGIVKCHIGRGAEADDARIAAIRDAIGPRTGFMVDLNCGYDRPTALRALNRWRPYDLFWLEEPLSPNDVEGYAQLRVLGITPIAGGENEYARFGFGTALGRQALDYAMPDLGRCGGITEMRRICALCEATGVPVSPHSFSTGVLLAATMQVMAALPDTQLLELDVTGTAIYDELFVEPLERHGALVRVPPGPGLGVTFDEKRLDPFRTR
jgi:D-galactarolactone cycloisomerase